MSEPGTRDYFAGVDKPKVDFVLLDADLLFGPLTPTPNTTLAEVVERINTPTPLERWKVRAHLAFLNGQP